MLKVDKTSKSKLGIYLKLAHNKLFYLATCLKMLKCCCGEPFWETVKFETLSEHSAELIKIIIEGQKKEDFRGKVVKICPNQERGG